MPRGIVQQLRDRATRAELAFIDLRARTGHLFRFQHPFNGFVLDFYCQRCRLCVEIDGGSHGSIAAKVGDAERTASLSRHGITVERFQNGEVLGTPDAVVKRLRERRCRAVKVAPPARELTDLDRYHLAVARWRRGARNPFG